MAELESRGGAARPLHRVFRERHFLLYREGEMSALNLTREEIFAAVGTCDAIKIEECTPPTLKEYICRRLEETQPALAKTLVPKVADLDDWQMGELCEYIRETHRLMMRRSRRLRRLNGHLSGEH